MKAVFNKKNIIIISVTFVFLGALIFNLYKNVDAKEKIILEENYLFDKIIVIGDSRMQLIMDKEDYNKKLPSNMVFIAKSGIEKWWFNKTALKKLPDYLNDFDGRKAVVINMGVNDLQVSTPNSAQVYIQNFNTLARLYPDTKFFIMSVNPINEDLISKKIKANKRTNENIERFNDKIVTFIEEVNYDNLKYCDAYNEIHFNTRDGLHYTTSTNEKIIEYILNDCLKK